MELSGVTGNQYVLSDVKPVCGGDLEREKRILGGMA